MRRLRPILAAVLLLAAVPLACPVETELVKFPDTRSYLREKPLPDPAETHLYARPPYARRAPTYPLFLDVVPERFVHDAQSWLSLACWALLGWVLAGAPGALLAGLFALSPLIRPWNTAMLSESLSLSLLALFLALSLALRRRLEGEEPGSMGTVSWLLGAAWAMSLLGFVFVRDVHLLALPFAALVLLPTRWSGAPREWTRFAVVSALLGVTLVVGIRGADAEKRGTMPVFTALHRNVFEDPEVFAVFQAAGLPDRQYPMTRAVQDWLEQGGRTYYLAWAARRLESHAEVWNGLAHEKTTGHLIDRYFPELAEPRFEWVDAVASYVQRTTAPPRWLWLAALLLPAAAWWRAGRLDGNAFAPLVLAALTYALGFASWWGAGTELVRHTLIASVLYHVTFAVALAGWIALAVAKRVAPPELA